MPYKNPIQQKESQRKSYLKTKNDYIQRNYAKRAEIKEWFTEYKKTLKCKRCPENDPACLDFHHTDPSKKEKRISQMVNWGHSRITIMQEVNKCEVLCSNCHRKLHAYELSEVFKPQNSDRAL